MAHSIHFCDDDVVVLEESEKTKTDPQKCQHIDEQFNFFVKF